MQLKLGLGFCFVLAPNEGSNGECSKTLENGCVCICTTRLGYLVFLTKFSRGAKQAVETGQNVVDGVLMATSDVSFAIVPHMACWECRLYHEDTWKMGRSFRARVIRFTHFTHSIHGFH